VRNVMWSNDMSDADMQYMLDIEEANMHALETDEEYEKDMAARDKSVGREEARRG